MELNLFLYNLNLLDIVIKKIDESHTALNFKGIPVCY